MTNAAALEVGVSVVHLVVAAIALVVAVALRKIRTYMLAGLVIAGGLGYNGVLGFLNVGRFHEIADVRRGVFTVVWVAVGVFMLNALYRNKVLAVTARSSREQP